MSLRFRPMWSPEIIRQFPATQFTLENLATSFRLSPPHFSLGLFDGFSDLNSLHVCGRTNHALAITPTKNIGTLIPPPEYNFPRFRKMLTSALLTLVTLSRFVVGQTVTPLPNTPQCLLTCSAKFCPTSQLQCLCVDEISNITVCALNTCNAADQATAGKIGAQICGTMFDCGC